MEDIEKRTFKYGGYEFVWGDDNQNAKEKRLLNWIVTVTNNNNKKGQKITADDADAKLGAPMKKRRRLEQEEALPVVCRLQAFKKWEALNDNIEIEYKKRFYIKGVHGMEGKLLAHMANAQKKRSQVESMPSPAVAAMAVAAAAKGAAI